LNVTEIGINEWLTPQISEHWPVMFPTRLEENVSWLIRPGRASVLTPREGTVQEWMTSRDVTKARMVIFVGSISWALVFNRRDIFDFSIKDSVCSLDDC
jgi:hypothetical protein